MEDTKAVQETNTTTHVVSWLDSDKRACVIDGIRYIKSWRGTRPKTTPKWSKEMRKEYMRAYRKNKKDEITRLKTFYENNKI